MSELSQLRQGLFRWTAPHPDWEAEATEDGPADWPRDVGCLFYEAREATVFIDPLVPIDRWEEFDKRVAERGLPVHVLTTVSWHRRSRAEVISRYGGSLEMVEDIQPLVMDGLDETLYWIPSCATLVAGDRLIGDGRGGVRVCPQSWLNYLNGKTVDNVKQALRKYVNLEIELLAISHGDPITSDARAAFQTAID